MIGLVAPLLGLAAGAFLAAALIPAVARTRVELCALAVGLGLMVATTATLLGLIHPLVLGLILGLVLVAVPLLLYAMHRRDGLPFMDLAPAEPTGSADSPATPRHSRRGWAWAALPVLALLLLAGAFRLPGLGYSEFQGDEARAMLLASRLVDGGGLETLLWHKKGPLEVILPAGAVKRGDLRESTARLPFALAGLGLVLAAYALGRRLWGPRAAFFAALLLALDGYLIAFSRIVQYQSVVALSSALAVWCAWRWYSDPGAARRYLSLAALFLAFGTWAHYEAALAAAPVAYLVAARARRERWPAGTWLRHLAWPLLLGAAVFAAFYLPFVRHPQFSATFRYIAERRVGGAAPYNMLGDYFLRASFYNASYAVALFLAALVATVALKLRLALVRFGWFGTLLWLGALVLVIARPDLFELGGRSLAILVFLPALALLWVSPTVDVRWRTILIWFALPFLLAGFMVQKPHTHFYTMITPGALLVGWGLDRGLAWLEGRWAPRPARVLALVAGAAFVLMAGNYLQQVFLRQVPEYKRVFPEAAAPGYWLPYGQELPRGGYFGFPYRAGWNEVRALFADGSLQGSYDSNEEPLITGWYTGGAVRCSANPRYYLVAWRPQDVVKIPPLEAISETHRLRATIRVHGQEKLWIYERREGGEIELGEDATSPGTVPPPLVLDETGGLLSLGGPASSFLDRPLAVSQALDWPLTQESTDLRFDHRLRLIGFDLTGLEAGEAARGAGSGAGSRRLPPTTERLGVVLAWEPYAPMDRDYAISLTLTDARGEVVGTGGEGEGAECGATTMAGWKMGEVRFTPHVLRLAPLPRAPGDYVLYLALHDRATGAPATARGSGLDGHAASVELARFRVEER